jgi:hypothetical protein
MKLNRWCTLSWSFAIVALLSLCGTGCHSVPTPKAWNVSIVKETAATIDVDLIGVSSLEKSDWANYNLNDYFNNPNDPRRKEALQSGDLVTFALKKGEASVLKIDDAHWKKWFTHGASELLILAKLPGVFSGSGDDPRRKFLYLGKSDWKAQKKTIEIEIQNTRIRVLTPQVPRD